MKKPSLWDGCGWNSLKAFCYMAYLIVPICAIFTFLILDSYVKVTDSKIGVNAFFSLGERYYSFEEVKFIKLVKSFKAPIGNIVYKPYFIIGFSDKSEINFHRIINVMGVKKQQELARFLSHKTKLDIQIEDPYPRKSSK